MLDDPCRIYDCSNSAERPSHRGGGGPVMNDVMRYLHEYAEDYYFKFTDSPQEAQVIITNDVFPAAIAELWKPMVKRMCGPFWNIANSDRNIPLNNAARLADEVIFISEYSKKQYFNDNEYNLKSHRVVTHWVDPNVFVPNNTADNKQFTFAACATNWNRPEKRLNDLIRFAQAVPDVQFVIVGTVEQELPANFLKIGYLDKPQDVAYILNSVNAFINLSYRDAATKTVPQAISCGLPVLYADSGGVGELVNGFGIAIEDSKCIGYETEVPSLDLNNVIANFALLKYREKDIKQQLQSFDRKLAFRKMLDGYFGTISSVLRD
jgi:glycosyltransferase involved in cell wall biosynthesis